MKIVFLTREPKDQICSLYHHITGRFKDVYNYKKSISEFIRDPYFGIDPLLKFRYIWRVLYNRLPNIIIVDYHDMHENPRRTLRKISKHFRFNISNPSLRRAARLSTFEAMREVEESGKFARAWLRPRNECFKMRKGVEGSYKDELSDRDIRFIDAMAEKYNIKQ